MHGVGVCSRGGGGGGVGLGLASSWVPFVVFSCLIL